VTVRTAWGNPAGVSATGRVDRTEAKESAKRLTDPPVPLGHRELKHESQPRHAVLERGLLRGDDEASFSGDDPAEREANHTPGAEQGWKELGGADADRTRDLVHAMDALYQLSYSPRAVQGTSGHSFLEQRT
jgi:hypothetical protein